MSTPPRRARAARAAAAALLLGLGLAGCPPKPPAVRAYPPPTPGELGAALAAQHAAVRSMNARARATSWLGGERVRAGVLMLVTRDGNLRFEAEVTLQGTVAILVTEGGRFAFLDLHRNELRRGPACPANVASLVSIPLEPPEVAAILLGDVELGAVAPGAGTVSWDPARGADVWTVPTPKGTALLAFTGDAAHRAMAGVTWEDASGKRLWRTSYEDFDAAGPVRLPSLIRFAEGDRSFDDGVEVHIKDRTMNVTPKPADFTLAPPPGAAVREVGCAERPISANAP
jgi:hypothetical protein